ncbi:carbohydrate ABC transporter permease [Paenibacillus agaridevorans]|uniref:carbohydrate ABC transporter permease n=1 Tax=Paenibacillus agaridevorans TaxID=171404 RepID=UPI002159ECD2|nr:carbohydrate ABC transporter permease [Paenibacillus agaridevorans]
MKVFSWFNNTFLILLAFICLFPLLHILAISFSSSAAASAGLVKLWPVDFTLKSYEFILSKHEFLKSMTVTFQRLVIGTAVNMILTVLIAYPLSKETKDLKFRTLYAWFFIFTILFGGGLIPWYMTIKYVGIMNSIWALILPSAVPVFNVILLLNFFRGIPKELEESSFIDGAGYWTTLWKIMVPISLPAMATVGLFTMVNHWNSWFDGLILMGRSDQYPLATYLQTIIKGMDLTKLSGQDAIVMSKVSDRTAKAAQIFVGTLPILIVYPFLQRYFVQGIVLGSVKE